MPFNRLNRGSGYSSGKLNKIDDICKEIETAMAGDQTVNGLAKNSFLAGTEINYSGEGEQPIGVVTLNYVVQYRTATNAPDVAV